MVEHSNLADELAYMAEHPDLFSKEEMASMLKQAAERIRQDKEGLAKVRAGIVEAIGHLDHLPVGERRRDS